MLYPGDRLVAYDAVLLLADVPVLFLPVVILPLQDQNRQPSHPIAPDGYILSASLFRLRLHDFLSLQKNPPRPAGMFARERPGRKDRKLLNLKT